MATGNNRLNGIRAKIERAKKHVSDFNSAWQLFRATDPYGYIVDFDAQTGHNVYKIKIHREIPEIIPLCIGDAVHNLRASLDYLAWQLVDISGGTPGSHTYFPISKTEAKYKASSPGKVNGMGSQFVNMIDALKPYEIGDNGQAGNSGLWILSELDIVDKHRMMLIAAFHINLVSVGFRPKPGNAMGIQTEFWQTLAPLNGLRPGEDPGPHWRLRFPMLEDGQEFARSIASNHPWEMQIDIDLSYDISFVEPKVVEAEPVLPMLTQLATLVESIVKIFEPFLV
jgi:hypothetical protein